jgi:hypothetical protein
MGKQDKRVDQYIAKSADFAKPILNHIRRLVHIGVPNVEETTKWSMPFFEYKGILCYMAAFKAHCSFGFWKTKLVLGKTKAELGKESTGAFGRIAAISDLPSEKVLIGYLKKAAQLNETGELPRIRVKPVSKEKKHTQSRAIWRRHYAMRRRPDKLLKVLATATSMSTSNGSVKPNETRHGRNG